MSRSIQPARSFGDWRAAGLRYHTYRHHLRQRFEGRVQRVSLDAGTTCPNVDGTVTTGGCNFCRNVSFSPGRRLKEPSITEQLDEGMVRIRALWPDTRGFLAYFQPGTNTYAPLDRLRALYDEATAHPDVLGLVIGTRPDCVAEPVLDLIQSYCGDGRYVEIEYGMQTMHDRSLDWMNRGHHHAAMVDAMQRSRDRGFSTCAHIILGIPGESTEDALANADEVNRLGLDAIKLHNLYAVHRTRFGEDVIAGRHRLLEEDEYVDLVVGFLERLDPRVVVQRITGDAPPDFFIGPAWSLDKARVRRAIEQRLASRDSYQGKFQRP